MKELPVSWSTQEMEQYLEACKGWVWIGIKQHVSQTIQQDQIMKHMMNSTNIKYMVVKAPHVRRVRSNISKITRGN
jgi:hypothetical protein